MDCSLPGSSVHGIFQASGKSGLPFPSPGDLPNLGIEPSSPTLRADAYPQSHQGSPREEGDEEKNKISEAPLSRNFTSQWGSGQRADVFSDVRQRQTP